MVKAIRDVLNIVEVTLPVIRRIKAFRGRKPQPLPDDHIVQGGVEFADISGARRVTRRIEQIAGAD